jgi:DNA repair exonuclease SbcCD ATPase subunit
MDPTKASPNNIDQIRQLIFGEQLQDYDRRFQEFQKKLDQLNKELQDSREETDKKLSDLQKSIKKDMDTHIKTIEKQLSDLSEDKLDRAKLADQLVDLAMRLKGTSILDNLDTGISSHAKK